MNDTKKLENQEQPTVHVEQIVSCESYIMIGNTKIAGNDLTAYHKKHNTASYHCINCGIEFQEYPKNYHPCDNCGFGS